MIKSVETTTLRNNLSDVVNKVASGKDYMLVTRRDKPVAALVNLDLLEDLLALHSKKYLQSIREARRDLKQNRYSSHKEVFGHLG